MNPIIFLVIRKERRIKVGVLFERQIVAYQKEQTENQHRQSYHDIEHLLMAKLPVILTRIYYGTRTGY